MAEFDHEAGRRAIDLRGVRGGVEVDVDADPDQCVGRAVAAPLALDQDAAKLVAVDLDVVGPLETRSQAGDLLDGLGHGHWRDNAEPPHLLGARSHDQRGVDALTGR